MLEIIIRVFLTVMNIWIWILINNFIVTDALISEPLSIFGCVFSFLFIFVIIWYKQIRDDDTKENIDAEKYEMKL